MHQISAPLKYLKFDGRIQISIGFLLLPGFPMACLSSVIEPLRAANEISGQEKFSWTLYSEDGTSVRSSARLSFEVDGALSDVSEVDFLVVLSEPDGTFSNPQSATGKLRYLFRHGTTLCAISGGVFPLARSGVLDGQTCSVHWLYRTAFAAEFPQIETTDDVIAINRRSCTASGAASAFDLALHVIDAALGESTMAEVACWFQHSAIRNPNIRQKTPTFGTDETADHLPDNVSRAISLFSENLEFPLTTREVARQVGVSARHLERSFRQAIGQSPGEYYRLLRLRAARQLVIYTQDSLTSIAHAVGYTSPTSMSRQYAEQFGASPRQDRQEHNRFRVTSNAFLH
ncbi:GlxA family transcriptional regulator [Ruegeria sp.]|uniref:GlxA family transcriptional regulator n=1 Tax=Ruegeria sp. TaxID=1879320 RepID=UPI003C7EB207